jgi:hypothetical protein
MSMEFLGILKSGAIVFSILIGAMDFLGVLTMLLERYGGMKGRLVGAMGVLLPKAIFGPLPRSLASLKDWHDPAKREELFKSYGEEYERDLMDKHPYSQWMVAEMTRHYENNVQGIAYLGAALLIFVIGLRGIQILTKDDAAFIILALLLEFTLIGVLGLMLFYKPEETRHHGMSLEVLVKLQELEKQLAEKDTALRVLRTDVEISVRHLQTEVDTLRRSGEGGKTKGSA